MYSIFGFYDELDYLTFCYEVSLVILIGISLLTVFKILWSKIFSSVNINCWFCGKVSKIEKSCSNWWFCLECEQWNGFKEDGDYYQIIPEMYEIPVHSTNEANLSKEKSLLCQACLSKQSRKINELAAFVPKDEKHFELESDDFERFLNEKYKPCLSCLSVISYHLQEQDKQIHMTHSQTSSSSCLRKLNMNSTSNSSKSIFKCVVKLMLLLALLWLYRLPTYISVKYVLVYPICFFIYFSNLYKSRSFRFKGLVSILGVLLYYFGGLKLVTIFVLIFYLIEVISTVWELLKWIFQIKVFSSFYQQKMSSSKVKKQQNHKFGSFLAEGIVSNGFNRVESFNDIPPQGNSIVTPDLLHGHLDAMQIGNKDSTLAFKGMVNEKNHVMAALKYKDVVNHKKDSSQRPLLRPATFILQQKKDSSIPDRILQDDEPFTKIRTNLVLKEKGISSEAVVLNKSSIFRKKLNWTYFAVGGLMGKIKDLKIQLDQNTPYFAGDLIVGQVTFNLIKCLSITRILLSFEGIGKCKNGVHCKENIHSCKITLFNDEQSHQIGFYKYPFNIQLPEKLPTSVKMDNASISYKISAKIKCKGSSNKSLKSRILITEVIDANICNTPSVTILRKTPSLFSNKQKLSSKELLVSLQRSVYCAEEQIVLNIQYKDRSPRYMGNIKAVLNRYVLFNPKENKYRFSVKKKIKEVSDSIPDKTTERSLLIPVPKSVMPSNCLANAVQVKYVLHVKIVGYPEHKIPVIIGTKAKAISTSYEEIFRSIDINEYPPGYGNTVMPTAPSYIDDNFDQFEECDRPLSTMFLYPPEYIPQNEFDIPPSYNETVSVISSSSNENI